jgi:hypothetical protein
MIKPSLTEVQNIARITTQAIKVDIEAMDAMDKMVLTEYDIIQLKIEQLLTETIRAFETEMDARFIKSQRPLKPTPCGTTHYPEQSPE